MNGRQNPLKLSMTLLFLMSCGGTLGYMIIERWTPFEAFYMTVITLATVGYGEVRPLGTAGKAFTVLLILSGVSVVAYTFSAITRLVVEGELKKLTGTRRMEKKIATLSGHIIICGYGRLGRIVVKELVEARQPVVVVESNPQITDELSAMDVLYVQGSAYEDEMLKRAGIQRASRLLTLLPHDADNVYVVLSARELNPKVEIITRTEGEVSEARLRRAGANRVISPYRVAGMNIVQQITRPHVSEFLRFAFKKGETPLVLEELNVPDSSELCGQTLEQCALPARTGAIIAALIDRAGGVTFNPGPRSTIESGSTLVVLGQPGSLDKLSELL